MVVVVRTLLAPVVVDALPAGRRVQIDVRVAPEGTNRRTGQKMLERDAFLAAEPDGRDVVLQLCDRPIVVSADPPRYGLDLPDFPHGSPARVRRPSHHVGPSRLTLHRSEP